MTSPRLDLGCADGDTVDELAGFYIELEDAARAIAEIARRGYEITLEEHKASGMVEIHPHEPPQDVEELIGLYATFECAADAVARLARRGLAADVDVYLPNGRTSGPSIEVAIAGPIDTPQEPARASA